MTVKHNKREADTAAGIAGLQTSPSPCSLYETSLLRDTYAGAAAG